MDVVSLKVRTERFIKGRAVKQDAYADFVPTKSCDSRTISRS